jgi:hypothetical protein
LRNDNIPDSSKQFFLQFLDLQPTAQSTIDTVPFVHSTPNKDHQADYCPATLKTIDTVPFGHSTQNKDHQDDYCPATLTRANSWENLDAIKENYPMELMMDGMF